MRVAKLYRYPLRLDRADKRKVDEVAKVSGRSISQILTLSIRKGLPLAREALCTDTGKITNVKALPDEVWENIYSKKDELDGCTTEAIKSVQSQSEPT